MKRKIIKQETKMTDKKAEIENTINLLQALQYELFPAIASANTGELVNKEPVKCDIRPLAEELSLDIDRVMEDIDGICSTSSYNVGGHMCCTRLNVLPYYKADKSLVLDRDHLEGLWRILLVEYCGRKDF